MEVSLNDANTWPQVRSIWKHHSGRQYVVVTFANVEQDRQDEYPTTIVYDNIMNGKRYSRKLSDWDRSMTLIANPK